MNRDSKLQIEAALTLALDQLGQYQRYAEEMRAIGRGFSPSSEFTEQSTLIVLETALRKVRGQS